MSQVVSPAPSGDMTNGANGANGDHTAPAMMQSNAGSTVLTLFGGDPRQPKQLFSSLGKRKSPDDLDEILLPNGIKTTKIIPTHGLDSEDKEKTTTFRDNYPTPAGLPSLPKPRLSTQTITVKGSVGWYTPSISSKRVQDPRKSNFATQPLPAGNWLTYNAPPAPRQDSPETKRKQRERALSFGAAQSPTNDEAIAAHNQAKDDALFKSVYSSFAPDIDDSLAVVAAQQKTQMWWYKYGEDMYQELLDIKDQELYGTAVEVDEGEDDINEDEIKEALDNWVPLESSEEFAHLANSKGREPSEKDTSELLAEISDLLDTLSSHQQIRNEALAPSARGSTGTISTVAGGSGHPSSPSTAEFDVYETLKSQLALIVSDLPPYLVAKLDGNKLGALNISTRIQVEGPNQKGTLMEDELSTRARAATRTPVSAAVSQTPGAYSSIRGGGYHPQTHTPSSHFSRPPYGAQTSAPRPSMPNSYSSGHYAGRPAAPAQYPPGGVRPPHPAAGYGADHRALPGYTQRFANGIPQYGTPQNQGSYPNGYRSQGHQASSYNPQYSTPQQRIPASAAATMQAYRATQSEYPQRPHPGGLGYGYGGSPTGNAVSPQPQHRLSFSAQGQSPNPQRPQLHHQHSSNHGSRTSAEPATNGAGTAGRMSPDEQAAIMDRQKAQLVERTSRQSSDTPQPATENGGQQNGTPGGQ